MSALPLLGDDDRDTLDMRVPTNRAAAIRRTLPWAAVIASVATAAWLSTGEPQLSSATRTVVIRPMNVPVASFPASTPEPMPAADHDLPPVVLPDDQAQRDAGALVQAHTPTLFDEPLDRDADRLPAPSLFGPDPIVPGAAVADARLVRDAPADEDYAQDVAAWIAAHHQVWFPAPQVVSEPKAQTRHDRTRVRLTLPPWLDQVVADAVRGGAMPFMIEPSLPRLP
jgi:hypothetical protein